VLPVVTNMYKQRRTRIRQTRIWQHWYQSYSH